MSGRPLPTACAVALLAHGLRNLRRGARNEGSNALVGSPTEVPETISQGRTPEEAKANVAEALELALAWRRDEGE